ncbi:MAG TPA: TVP38/TMEM64 family protein [Gemmatimonadota bacterium]|nr:TVP38/TMEM64 family protein [Gemmatimonadota bacterium]
MRDRSAFRASLLAVTTTALLLAALLLPIREWTTTLLAWIGERGPWAGAILGLAWIPSAVLLVPGTILTLGTGFLLGLGRGLAVVSLGSTVGATAAFLVGRYLGRDWVRRRIGERRAFEGIDRAIEAEGLKVVLLLRLSPLVPFNALNYALALTGVRLRDYVLGSWVGMLPGTLLYVWLGAGARSLAAIAAGTAEHPGPWLLLFGAGLAATALAVFLVARAARRALAALAETS